MDAPLDKRNSDLSVSQVQIQGGSVGLEKKCHGAVESMTHQLKICSMTLTRRPKPW